MKYFETGKKHGAYHEFVQGKRDEDALIFRSAGSLYLHDDVVCDFDLYRRLFKAANIEFNKYGVTEITHSDRNALVNGARELGGEA